MLVNFKNRIGVFIKNPQDSILLQKYLLKYFPDYELTSNLDKEINYSLMLTDIHFYQKYNKKFSLIKNKSSPIIVPLIIFLEAEKFEKLYQNSLFINTDDYLLTPVYLNEFKRKIKNYINLNLLSLDYFKKIEEIYISLFENLSSAVIVVNKAGYIKYINKFLITNLKIDTEEIINKNIKNFISLMGNEKIWHRKINTGFTLIDGEITFKDKKIPLKLTFIPIQKQTEDTEILIIGIDKRKEIELEKEREKIQTQLLHLQKMESIYRLTGGIMHDFNNLLTVIKSNAEFLLEKNDLPIDIKNSIEEINITATKAAMLTRQLLLLSKSQVSQKSILNLNEIIENLEKILNRVMGENIKINLNLNNEIKMIMGDPTQIEQVILNLAINSRDAMPNGGEFFITTTPFYLTEKELYKFPGLKKGEYVKITIKDTGIGMDNETMERIFEPFFSTKEKSKNTGLGLSVVYTIIHNHNGLITVDSERGKGTKFEIYLPATTEKTQKIIIKKNEKTYLPVQQLNYNLLIIEDEISISRILQQILTKYGFNVFSASTIKEAINTLNEIKPKILITDVMLPDGNILNNLNELKAKYPDLKIILMTGYSDKEIENELLNNDCFFIQKPFRIQDILIALKNFVNVKNV